MGRGGKKKTRDELQVQLFSDFHPTDPVRISKAVELIVNRHPGGGKLLELGATVGGVADVLSKRGWKCYGVDICERKISGVKTFVHDLNHSIPLKEKFDMIFAGELIEHIVDDDRFLRACREHLNEGGSLCLTTPNVNFLANRALIPLGKMPLFTYCPGHYHMYNMGILREKLEKNGFHILDARSSHVFFSTRRHALGRIFEVLGDWMPTLGAHLIVLAGKDSAQRSGR